MCSIPTGTKSFLDGNAAHSHTIPIGIEWIHALFLPSAMRYQLLGPSGLRVSELALGTMTFGDDWGWGASKSESRRIFDAFAEAGGTFIDTANVYTNGTSERLVGEFVAPERDRFVVATKYAAATRPGDPNSGGNGRKALVQSVEGSLTRLGTDYIDLLWVHAWDGVTPVDEVVRALDDLVRAGKVLHIGISDTPAWVVSEAITLARERGLTPFSAIQVEYSLVERTPERDLLPMAAAHGLSVLDWSPLGAGALTGKHLAASRDVAGGRLAEVPLDFYDKYRTDRAQAIAREVVGVATETERSPAQVALAWVLHQPGRHIPILGARSVAHFEDNLSCLDVRLSDLHMARLDAASQIELGFPHDLLAGDAMRQMVFGGTYDRTDAGGRTRPAGPEAGA